jgi:hypothetical protein
MAVDGHYAGKLPDVEVTFLAEEAARIRQETEISDKVMFDSKFLSLWPSIWGAELSYDMVLLRHFYQPEADRQRVETAVAIRFASRT